MDAAARLELLKQAEGLALDGKPADAIPLCDRVLAEFPENGGALNLKGFCLATLGRDADALPLFKLARLYLPDYPPARFNLAKGLEKSGDLKGAAAEYAEVLKLTPDDAEARASRGALLQALGDGDGALKEFQELLRREPGGRSLMLLGGCHLAAKRLKEAHAAFEQALKEEPSLKPEIDRLIAEMAKFEG